MSTISFDDVHFYVCGCFFTLLFYVAFFDLLITYWICKMDGRDGHVTKGKNVTFRVENDLYVISLDEISGSNFLKDLYDMTCGDGYGSVTGNVTGNVTEGDVPECINIPYSKELWNIYISRMSILESCTDMSIMVKLLNVSSMFMDEKTTDLACDKIILMLKTGYL
jgi:hypothetical protein